MPEQPDVVIGSVPFDPEPSRFAGPLAGDNQKSIYADYMIINRYERDQHTYMMGVTLPDGSPSSAANGIKKVAFVQLALPTMMWIIDWTAAKFNGIPDVPDPTPSNSDWVILDIHVETPNIMLNPGDGVTPYYRVNGTYYYGFTEPTDDLLKGVVFPRPPWLEDVFIRLISINKLDRSLTEPVIRAGAGPDRAGLGGAR